MTGKLQATDMTSADIEDALERVLSSKTFTRSARARELLDYLVKQEQAGNAAMLKEFSIAQDVFDKDDRFDPSIDAVVRVQAGRLRDNLTSYYADEGAHDGVRISIPLGTYVPSYETNEIDDPNADNGRSAGGNDAETSVSADDPAPLNFGAPVATLSLDDDGIEIGAINEDKEPTKVSNVPVNPFVIKAINRFTLAIFGIFILLGIILILLWPSAPV